MEDALPREIIDEIFSYLPTVHQWCAATTVLCHPAATCRGWRRHFGYRTRKCRRWTSSYVEPFNACALHTAPRHLEALCDMNSAAVVAMDDLLRSPCTYLHVHPETVITMGVRWPIRLFLPHVTSSRMCCEGTGLKVYRGAFARMMEWAENLEE